VETPVQGRSEQVCLV